MLIITYNISSHQNFFKTTLPVKKKVATKINCLLNAYIYNNEFQSSNTEEHKCSNYLSTYC